MLKDNNLVRRLQACETMGGANNICSDKTGTLTMNKMTLTTMWNGSLMDLDLYSQSIDLGNYVPPSCQHLLVEAITCNSSASLVPLTGSKTEIALLEFINRARISCDELRAKHLVGEYVKFPFSSQRKRMGTILENVTGGPPSRRRLHEKGASEMILAACTHWHNWKANTIEEIDESMRKKIEGAIQTMASQALRTIGAAYRDIHGREDLISKDEKNVFEIEKSGLVLLTIFGIKDIIRAEVPGAIAKCNKAGIRVRMVTGDNKDTAKAIAKECGIIKPGDTEALVLEGPDFIARVGGVVCKRCRTEKCECPTDPREAEERKREMRVDTIKNKEEFDKIIDRLDVLARSRPEDKYALVTGLRERGNVVAVTGDGTNDAPALKKADVGFAMGIAGTEVAREAAAIILLDDNFTSIVKAVMWGRNIYDSIQKFLQFQLTVNFVAVTCTVIGAALLKQPVLRAIQLLWVNLIMDTFASLALATEPPTEGLLDRKPHDKHASIISNKMMKHIVGQALYQVFVLILIVFNGENMIPERGVAIPGDIHPKLKKHVRYNPNKSFPPYEKGYMRSGRDKSLTSDAYDYEDIDDDFGPSRHFTVVFNVFVAMTIFNFLNARKLSDEKWILSGIFSSQLFPVIILSIIGMQILIIEFGGRAFDCHFEGLTIEQWMICIGFGLFGTIWSFFLKFIPEEPICQKIRHGRDKMKSPLSGSRIMSLKRSPDYARKLSGLSHSSHGSYRGERNGAGGGRGTTQHDVSYTKVPLLP
eukprot:TRINITY_DN5087_c0_g4_i1.p1 TRINITY_DN5087_c0_g4~~TRINITY_DN5087_c0_g4_i1.p1  ORF type:complete len:760 (+),score=146.86 TRINITY_DN5087_c0_g4_i1:252-2531(+)